MEKSETSVSLFVASFVVGMWIVPQPAIAQAVVVQATWDATTAWKMGKPARTDITSVVVSITLADDRPIQASDYSSIYVCVVPGCVLAPLEAVRIAPAAAIPQTRPFRLARGAIAKWGTLPAAQLSGTEYNGSVVSNGPTRIGRHFSAHGSH